MRSVLINFLQLQAQNVEDVILMILAAIYILALLTTLTSVLSRPRGFLFKLAWFVLSVILPFVGMALYACYCISQADRSFFSQLGFSESKRATPVQQQKHLHEHAMSNSKI